MTDLQLAPPRSRSVLPAVFAAVVVLALAAWALFRYSPDRVSDTKVTGVQVFAPHTTMQSLATRTHGNMRVLSESTAAAGEDDVYVVATASITNRLRIPIYLEGSQAHVTLANGQALEPRIVFGNTLQRLQTLFPALAPMVRQPLALDDEVDPGQTRTGSVVFLLPGVPASAWQQKREATLTLLLRNQAPQTAKLP